MQFTIRDIISASAYAEFPDVVVTAELARAEADLDKRSIPRALRMYASLRASSVDNRHLRAALVEMSKAPFPEVHLTRIKSALTKMETKLSKLLGGGVVECESREELHRMLGQFIEGGKS